MSINYHGLKCTVGISYSVFINDLSLFASLLGWTAWISITYVFELSLASENILIVLLYFHSLLLSLFL